MVRIFRELNDSPFRKKQRDRPSPTKDEGDLFIHRPSPRKIRILLDIEQLPEDNSEAVAFFEALLRHERVFALQVETSTIHLTDTVSAKPGHIRVRDTTAVAGSFAYPGPQYGWSIMDEDLHLDGSSTLQRGGSSNPHMQIAETRQVYQQLDEQHRADFRLEDAVDQAIVTEVAHSAGFDILVSEAPASSCRFLPVHDRIVVLSRSEAVPVIAHYLRRQHIFLFDPHGPGMYARHSFYDQSVHALAPAIRGWKARADLATPDAVNEVHARCGTVIRRLARALESRDDILWSLGSHSGEAVRNDCVDDFDHLLFMLCSAIDVTAGILHLALELDPENLRNGVKLHTNGESSWFKTNVAARYRSFPTERSALKKLDSIQTDVKVVFELRNSIHNVGIGAVPTGLADFAAVSGGGVELPPRDRVQLSAYIDQEMLGRIQSFDEGIEARWGFKEVAGKRAVADLWLLADKAVETTFKFLNLLSLIVLRNPLPSSDSAMLSGQAPALSWKEALDAFNGNLPILLGMAEPEELAPDKCDIPSAEEPWWIAHVRSSLVQLQATDTSNGRGSAEFSDDQIREALRAERALGGIEWPAAPQVAQAIYTKLYSPEPAAADQ